MVGVVMSRLQLEMPVVSGRTGVVAAAGPEGLALYQGDER